MTQIDSTDADNRNGQEHSQTAQEYISSQLQLEADAREVLPYQFDTCTKPLGPLRQNLFACLTCNPTSTDKSSTHQPAGICYACSISCHGEHELVELFSRRDFECDCGTTRFPSTSTCALRLNPRTSRKGDVHSETPREENDYNQNFENRFCGCGELYDPHKQKGTMFQCLGLGKSTDGGCGEDWWHPECILGIDKNWRKKKESAIPPLESSAVIAGKPQNESKFSSKVASDPAADGVQSHVNGAGELDNEEDEEDLPPEFPAEDDFDHFLCYRCVEAFPWIKRYAGSSGFLDGVGHQSTDGNEQGEARALVPLNDRATSKNHAEGTSMLPSQKRKSHEADLDSDYHTEEHQSKKVKDNEGRDDSSTNTVSTCRYQQLPSPPASTLSLFLKEDFRDHLCRCHSCFPALKVHPQLLEEEDTYEPPASEASSVDGAGGTTHSSQRSLLDRGEAALSNMDRVKAIEGVMAYNHLRDKVKTFLKPFAESGQAVGAEDVKKYFEKLRGDEQAIRDAGSGRDEADPSDGQDHRREQGGY